MTPIKYRIAHEGKFYYWGFIAAKNGLEFNYPHIPRLSQREFMEKSERLLGYDRFGNEVWQGDYVDDGSEQMLTDGYLKLEYMSPAVLLHCRKTGNTHNIQEELKHG